MLLPSQNLPKFPSIRHTRIPRSTRMKKISQSLYLGKTGVVSHGAHACQSEVNRAAWGVSLGLSRSLETELEVYSVDFCVKFEISHIRKDQGKFIKKLLVFFC